MAILIISVDSTNLYYDELVTLENREYLFEFFWSTRESCWYLSLYDQDNNPIALWIRVVVTWPLLRRFAGSDIPPGLLMAVDQSGMNEDAQVPTDLGSRVILTYTTSDDPSLVGVDIRTPI